jgi:homoserine kinase
MHTEYTLKFEFHTPSKEALATFVRACRQAAQELSTQCMLLSGEAPTISFIVENNEIGIKKLKIFNGEGA